MRVEEQKMSFVGFSFAQSVQKDSKGKNALLITLNVCFNLTESVWVFHEHLTCYFNTTDSYMH